MAKKKKLVLFNDVVDPNFLDLRKSYLSRTKLLITNARATVKASIRNNKLVSSFMALLIIGVLLFVLSNLKTYDPIPESIQRSVSFSLYFPDSNKLPFGYSLDKNSFSSNGQAVLYTVNRGNTRLIFTIQSRPTNLQIQSFYTNHMPLHNNVNTPVGTAAIGVINNETVASLPTDSNAWILITAPINFNQNLLNQTLQSITKAN